MFRIENKGRQRKKIYMEKKTLLKDLPKVQWGLIKISHRQKLVKKSIYKSKKSA